MLLLALSGLLLSRLAHRALLALLFQLPPGNTRLLTFRSRNGAAMIIRRLGRVMVVSR
jgi:hypothetical protein